MLREFMTRFGTHMSAGTSLLALPIATLIFFVAFFVGVVLLVSTRSKKSMAAAASLPLQDETTAEETP
jgi:cbb3-type cytochrome oxidase subunit 3